MTPEPLAPRQAVVLAVVVRYVEATEEPCPIRYVARRLGLHPSTVQEHFGRLARKGWLLAEQGPARPRITPTT